MMNPKKLTRRAALSGIGLAVGSGVLEQNLEAATVQPQPPVRDPRAAIPISGQAGPGLEPFEDNPVRPRSDVFSDTLGPRYIDLAFRYAHQADPSAK